MRELKKLTMETKKIEEKYLNQKYYILTKY